MPRENITLDVKQDLGNALALTGWLIAGVGCFWMMCMRKFGTMGTMVNAIPFLIGLVILLVLYSGAPVPDIYCFELAIYASVFLFVIHFWWTFWRRRKAHVHTYHLGEPRFRSYHVELLMGLIAFFTLLPIVPLFAEWLLISAICCYIFTQMIEKRDQWRSYIVKDKLLEQKRMVELYV